MKLQFLSINPAIKTDLAVIKYQFKPPIPTYLTVPVCILVSLSCLKPRRRWAKFKEDLTNVELSGQLQMIHIELGFQCEFTEASRGALSKVIERIRGHYTPSVVVVVSPMNKSWQTSKALGFLSSLKVVLTTHYLENDLVTKGWAKTYPSKRRPSPPLVFAPSVGGEAYVVLWGSYGEGIGSYDYRGFLNDLSKNLMNVARVYQLKNIWIEFRNDEGRMDFPLPSVTLIFASPENLGYQDLYNATSQVMAIPYKQGKAIKPSEHDQNKFLEEWKKNLFLLDGLKF